jgi:hypothetical protein
LVGSIVRLYDIVVYTLYVMYQDQLTFYHLR